MKLFGSHGSPFARKARMVMLEKKVACEFVAGRAADPGSPVPKHNPLGKVPLLVLDDGRAVYDSVVIAEYFDHVGQGPRLIPEKFEDRIQVRRLEALCDGIAEASIAITHDPRYSPGCDPQQDWYQKQLVKMERALGALQEDVGNRDFCFGNAFSLGDAAAAMALGYLDRAKTYDWRGKFPGLKRYAEKLFARPSFRATEPPAPA